MFYHVIKILLLLSYLGKFFFPLIEFHIRDSMRLHTVNKEEGHTDVLSELNFSMVASRIIYVCEKRK